MARQSTVRGPADAMQHQERNGYLAEHWIILANNGYRGHSGVEENCFFDLAGKYLFSSAVDHVVNSSVQKEVSILVNVPEVTSPEPPIVIKAVTMQLVAIGPDHRGTADLHVPAHIRSFLAWRAVLRPSLRHNAEFGTNRESHRTSLACPLEWVRRNLAAGLGHSIRLKYSNPGMSFEPSHRLDSEWSRSRPYESNARWDDFVRLEFSQSGDDGGGQH
jgi:hypothetical protein